jgi:hypothetical protein
VAVGIVPVAAATGPAAPAEDRDQVGVRDSGRPPSRRLYLAWLAAGIVPAVAAAARNDRTPASPVVGIVRAAVEERDNGRTSAAIDPEFPAAVTFPAAAANSGQTSAAEAGPG